MVKILVGLLLVCSISLGSMKKVCPIEVMVFVDGQFEGMELRDNPMIKDRAAGCKNGAGGVGLPCVIAIEVDNVNEELNVYCGPSFPAQEI